MPGGHIRKMIRDMLFSHIRDMHDTAERIAEAKNFVMTLANPGDLALVPDSYRDLLREQARTISMRTDEAFFHDELAAINDPFYISEFMGQATVHGLQFLGEAEFFEMSEDRFTPSTAKVLEEAGRHDVLLKEQYLDFLKCRQFRQTLLCRQGLKLDRSFRANTITSLLASCNAKRVEDADPGPDGQVTYSTGGRGSVTTADPLAHAALNALAAVHPRALPFGTLLDSVDAVLREAGDQRSRFKVSQRLAEFLWRSHRAGMVELHTLPPHVVLEPAERPLASPLARLQAHTSDLVTNLRCEDVRVEDERARAFLDLLDGTRDRQAILDDIVAVLREDEPASPAALEEGLLTLGRLGLLVR
jgi:methyltransferase-like protein